MSRNTLSFLGVSLLVALSAACRPASPSPTVAPCEPCEAVEQHARVSRQPVLILTEHGPWGTAYHHTDTPTFALYEDGLVLFVEGEGADARVMQTVIGPQDVYAMLDSAQSELASLPKLIDVAGGATDQAQATIVVRNDNRTFSVGVYGLARDGTPSDPSSRVPASFLELQRRLRGFRHADAEPWQPDEIEVVLWKKDDLETPAGAWPEAVPLPPTGSREPRPFRKPAGKTQYPRPIIYRIDGSLESSVAAALDDAGEMTPLAWDGHKWLVRTRRIVPGREQILRP